MSIVTFYSYKGGVGRSMAVANIALLLARRGHRVLAVDWDLEAPGLDKYFAYFDIEPKGPGLLRMFMDAMGGASVDYRSYLSTVDARTSHPIALLGSGRELDPDYSRNLESFRWSVFFGEHGGGDFIEGLRHRWLEDYDFVLLDSRTGLSDAGGICTIQMPDIVVAMFTANQQSLYGVVDVMRLAQKARQGLAYDRMGLSIIPLASRWGDGDFSDSQTWLDRIGDAVKEFLDWLPRTVPARDAVQAMKIPHNSYFGFGERLAVVEQGTVDPGGMGAAYQRIADFLSSDLSDLKPVLGERMVAELPALDAVAPAAGTADGYQYDVFVSYDRSVTDWVLEFVEALKKEMSTLRPDVKFFLDVREVQLGDIWRERQQEALARSRALLPIITPRYLEDDPLRRELSAFRKRSAQVGSALVFPVVLRGDVDKRLLGEKDPWLDMRDVPLRARGARDSHWYAKLRTVARGLNQMLESAPPFDPSWSKLGVEASVPRDAFQPDVFDSDRRAG